MIYHYKYWINYNPLVNINILFSFCLIRLCKIETIYDTFITRDVVVDINGTRQKQNIYS